MRMTHDCRFPDHSVYYTVVEVTKKWVCPICGEAWEIRYRHSGHTACRLWPRLRVIRHWKWRRQVRRQMKEEGFDELD